MTTEELYKKYKEVFILVMEAAGETMGNETYKNVESIVNAPEFDEEILKYIIRRGGKLDVVIAVMICNVVVKVHGADVLSKEENIDKYVIPVFDLYLRKPTIAFCQQNGVPVIKSLNWHTMIRQVNLNNND